MYHFSGFRICRQIQFPRDCVSYFQALIYTLENTYCFMRDHRGMVMSDSLHFYSSTAVGLITCQTLKTIVIYQIYQIGQERQDITLLCQTSQRLE